MEHPCYKCGAGVEEGVPFCSNCGAPQIRVATAPVTPPLAPGEGQPFSDMATPPGSGGVPQTRGIDWSQAMPGATLAGVLVAGAWLLPSITVFLWVLAGGALATALYHRHRPDAVLTPGAGARIGVVSGLLGFVLFAVTMAATLLATGGDKLREMIQQVIEQATARNADPAAQEMLQRFNSPAGIAAMMTIVMVVFLVVFAGLSAVGGAIGASLVSKHRKGGNAQQ